MYTQGGQDQITLWQLSIFINRMKVFILNFLERDLNSAKDQFSFGKVHLFSKIRF